MDSGTLRSLCAMAKCVTVSIIMQLRLGWQRFLITECFVIFGLPEKIHSDRGSQFEGDLMTELCKL